MSNPITNPIVNVSIKDMEERFLNDLEERFLNDLKLFDGREYFYQKAMVRENSPWHANFLQALVDKKDRCYEKYDKKGLPVITGMDLGAVKHYTYNELKSMTESFSQSNLICNTRCGRLFRGKIPENELEFENVLVKTWDFLFPSPARIMGEHPARLHDELRLLMDPDIKGHPNVAKLIGFHCEHTLAVVYKGEGSPMKLLTAIITSDKFGWNDRMKVATDVGSVLKTLYDKGHVRGGVTAANILVDQIYDSMIFNFPDRGDYGQVSDLSRGSDVCAFAILLLELIEKGTIFDGSLSDINKLVVRNSFCIDEQFFFKVRDFIMKCFKEMTTIATFVDGLESLVGETLPNKRRNTLN